MKPQRHTLKNKNISVTINSKGAEMSSLKSKNTEYLWQGEPAIWGRHAPVLFPIVGRLVDHEYKYKRKTYPLSQHGFARDMDFKIVDISGSHIVFELKATKKTKAIYPFNFVLQITYTLSENTLRTTYSVQNPSKKEQLLFSIGAHPAFNCPLKTGHKRSDYKLVFGKAISPKALLHKNGLYAGKKAKVFSKPGVLEITESIFNNDSLTFSPNPFSKVSLVHKKTKKEYLKMAFKNFPYLAIWSKDSESPFICIEPWHGIADNQKHNKSFEKKEGIIKLKPSETFQSWFDITIMN